jgi:hypothetical protein
MHSSWLTVVIFGNETSNILSFISLPLSSLTIIKLQYSNHDCRFRSVSKVTISAVNIVHVTIIITLDDREYEKHTDWDFYICIICYKLNNFWEGLGLKAQTCNPFYGKTDLLTSMPPLLIHFINEILVVMSYIMSESRLD